MKAIFITGGKQYYVNEGDTIYVEKIDAEAGSTITFDDILYVDGKMGKPFVENAKVICEVEKHGKNKKIIVFKYHPKNNHIVKNKDIDNHILN